MTNKRNNPEEQDGAPEENSEEFDLAKFSARAIGAGRIQLSFDGLPTDAHSDEQVKIIPRHTMWVTCNGSKDSSHNPKIVHMERSRKDRTVCTGRCGICGVIFTSINNNPVFWNDFPINEIDKNTKVVPNELKEIVCSGRANRSHEPVTLCLKQLENLTARKAVCAKCQRGYISFFEEKAVDRTKPEPPLDPAGVSFCSDCYHPLEISVACTECQSDHPKIWCDRKSTPPDTPYTIAFRYRRTPKYSRAVELAKKAFLHWRTGEGKTAFHRVWFTPQQYSFAAAILKLMRIGISNDFVFTRSDGVTYDEMYRLLYGNTGYDGHFYGYNSEAQNTRIQKACDILLKKSGNLDFALTWINQMRAREYSAMTVIEDWLKAKGIGDFDKIYWLSLEDILAT